MWTLKVDLMEAQDRVEWWLVEAGEFNGERVGKILAKGYIITI